MRFPAKLETAIDLAVTFAGRGSFCSCARCRNLPSQQASDVAVARAVTVTCDLTDSLFQRHQTGRPRKSRAFQELSPGVPTCDAQSATPGGWSWSWKHETRLPGCRIGGGLSASLQVPLRRLRDDAARARFVSTRGAGATTHACAAGVTSRDGDGCQGARVKDNPAILMMLRLMKTGAHSSCFFFFTLPPSSLYRYPKPAVRSVNVSSQRWRPVDRARYALNCA